MAHFLTGHKFEAGFHAHPYGLRLGRNAHYALDGIACARRSERLDMAVSTRWFRRSLLRCSALVVR